MSDRDFQVECQPDRPYSHLEAIVSGSTLVILGNPDQLRPLPEGQEETFGHNCDAMGCGQDHVLFRVDLRAFLAEREATADPEWHRPEDLLPGHGWVIGWVEDSAQRSSYWTPIRRGADGELAWTYEETVVPKGVSLVAWHHPPAPPKTEPRSLPAARRRFEMAIHDGKEPERTGP